jgi:hypothetical protein
MLTGFILTYQFNAMLGRWLKTAFEPIGLLATYTYIGLHVRSTHQFEN